jgi:methylenetetrahydrofolate reductase (NADPH)
MALPVGAARYLHRGTVPGVVVTDDLLALIEAESHAPDRGRARRLDRLALQVVGAERLGYAGAQLSGLSSRDDVSQVLDLVAGWRARLATDDDWRRAWDELLRLPTGRTARLRPPGGYALFDGGDHGGRAEPVPAARYGRYLALRTVHRAVFDPASPAFHLLRLALRPVPRRSRAATWLAALERSVKAPLVGCRMCGECRLPSTFYVCPETCPKGLANGPCGGSTGNLCEAGDRECIHATTYRLAKAAGRLGDLEHGLVPPAPGRPGESSWLTFFADPGPDTPAAAERSARDGSATAGGPERRDGR